MKYEKKNNYTVKENRKLKYSEAVLYGYIQGVQATTSIILRRG